MQTLFDAPMGNDPVALNLSSMGKGEAWVNGQSIGRYWSSYHDDKGNPSQIMYVAIIAIHVSFVFQNNKHQTEKDTKTNLHTHTRERIPKKIFL